MATMETAAGFYRGGRAVGFESIGEYVGPDMAVIVEVERFEAKMGGSSDTSSVSLRCTSVSGARLAIGGRSTVTPTPSRVPAAPDP